MTTTTDFIRECGVSFEHVKNVLRMMRGLAIPGMNWSDETGQAALEELREAIVTASTVLAEALDRLGRLEKVRVATLVEFERHKQSGMTAYPCQCVLCTALREAEEG